MPNSLNTWINFTTKAEIPWVQLIWTYYYSDSVPHSVKTCGYFWWRDNMKLADFFTQFRWCALGPSCGDSFLFWTDKWQFMGSAEPLSARFPRLFSFASDRNL
jgi:hypothetical protein